MDIQQRLTAFALLGATWVMWLLIALSVISVAIMLERAYFMASTRDNIDSLRKDLLDYLRRNDLVGARKRVQTSRAFEAAIALAGIESAGDGPAAALSSPRRRLPAVSCRQLRAAASVANLRVTRLPTRRS